ncbi:MAG: transcriptional regulator, partial [Nitrospinaceae bacterium]
IERCPLNLDHHQTRLCPLHRRLEEVVCAIEQVFGSTTLADLLEDPASRPPLCQVKENDAA